MDRSGTNSFHLTPRSPPPFHLLPSLTGALDGDVLTPQLLQKVSAQLKLMAPEDAAQQLLEATAAGSPGVQVLCGALTQRCGARCAHVLAATCCQVIEQQGSPMIPLESKAAAIILVVAMVASGRMAGAPLFTLAQALAQEATHPSGETLAKVRCLCRALSLALTRQPGCQPHVAAVVDRLDGLPAACVPSALRRLRRRLRPGLPESFIVSQQPEVFEASLVYGGAAMFRGRHPYAPPGRVSDWDILDSGSFNSIGSWDPNDMTTTVGEMERQAAALHAENAALQREVEAAEAAVMTWPRDREVMAAESRQLRGAIHRLHEQNAQLSQHIAECSVQETALPPPPSPQVIRYPGGPSGRPNPYTASRPLR